MKRRTALIAAATVAVIAAIAFVLTGKPLEVAVPDAKPALGGWLPPSLDPKPVAADAWSLAFPDDVKLLPVAPVNEPHVRLNLGRPLPIHSLRLGAYPSGAFKA